MATKQGEQRQEVTTQTQTKPSQWHLEVKLQQ